MDESETQISILILIGLPGSGKTTFSKYLQEYLENLPSPIRVICICYDKILTVQNNESVCQWSDARKNMVKDVENIIRKLKADSEITEECKLNLSLAQNKKIENLRTLVIIDDNMYYRSMRYNYYQVARISHIGFCQLYLKCNIQECLKRNANRNIQEIIPSNIIEKMARNLEEPNMHKHTWEKCSCTISSENSFTLDNMKMVHQILEYAFKHPIEPLPYVDRERSRLICLSTVIHQVDLCLRKIVGNEIKQSKLNSNAEQIKELSKVLSTERQNIMDRIKSGELTIPEDIYMAVGEGQLSVLPRLNFFLSAEFTRTLKNT